MPAGYETGKDRKRCMSVVTDLSNLSLCVHKFKVSEYTFRGSNSVTFSCPLLTLGQVLKIKLVPSEINSFMKD